jgi:hypothetical protein
MIGGHSGWPDAMSVILLAPGVVGVELLLSHALSEKASSTRQTPRI